MLARFRQESAAIGAPYAFDEWGWLAYAQHHRVPTRLLDWSQSPLVALYFASEEPAGRPALEPDGELFLLHPSALNTAAGDNNGGHPRLLAESEQKLHDYLPSRNNEPSMPRAVIAPLSFDRIRFQTGTFTLEQRPSGRDGDEPLRDSNAIQRILIPGPSKAGIREELEILGFNEVSIYRDLDRIGKRIADTGARRTL